MGAKKPEGELRIEYQPLSKILPAEFNPHENDVGELHNSISRFGFTSPVLLNETTGRLVAGHGRLTTLRQRKAEGQEPPEHIVARKDDWYLPVIRGLSFKTDEEASAYLIADNRLVEIATWEDVGLAKLLTEIAASENGLVGTGYDGDDLDELLMRLRQADTAGNADLDTVPDPPEDPITTLGDVWILGRHRLMCGDGTNQPTVAALIQDATIDMVFTDPPYGINAVKAYGDGHVGTRSGALVPFGGVRKGSIGGANPFGGKKGSIGGDNIIPAGEYAPVIGDDSVETAVAAYALCAAMPPHIMIFWGGNYYANFLPPSRCWLVWDKENTGNFADVELAWTNQDKGARLLRHMWNGLMKASEKGERRVHPTQKPVALAEWAFDTLGKSGDNVLDLFGGSGSTLIACERTNRTCYVMELAPAYCDVIAARWERLTGLKAERIPVHAQDAQQSAPDVPL
jgi:16S rRNA G966 N2-methylase RsmD